MEFPVELVVMRQLLTTLTVTPSCAVAEAASTFGLWRKRMTANKLRSLLASFESVQPHGQAGGTFQYARGAES